MKRVYLRRFIRKAASRQVVSVGEKWRQRLGRVAQRARLERPLVLLLTLVAALALLGGMEWVGVLVAWALLVLVVVTRKPNEADTPAPVAPEEEVLPFDPLPPIAGTLGGLDIPAFVLAADASVLFQNKAAETAFGSLPSGSHLTARLRSPGILDMVRETIATDEPNQMEHSERLPSERVYILRVAPIPVFVPEGLTVEVERQKLYLLSFRDISELRRIDRMRSDFGANASHELRTPLASLRGFIETLQGPARSDPAAHERFLGIMFDQATRMSRLVDDLMSLSRLELKSHIAPDQMIDLRPILSHVRDTLLPLADDLGVDIRMHLPPEKVEVLGDRDELVQVFENLIENACKYGQEGKFVDVHLTDAGTEPVEVSVVDQGPGIPAEHVPRLTERFYRVSVADSRSKKGTGLGLAIVKHILTRHRARLIVRSEVGKGSQFTVRF
jgi:two-component system phosphate regulon sensor histidine kinase PhoR